MRKTEIISPETPVADLAQAVEKGLSQTPKRLPSWMFYDETGDRLFQSIMHMPEYYLTNCEYEILKLYKEEFFKLFTSDGSPFELVEFGAGDGLKTEILLRHFTEKKAPFSYLPVDVSEAVLDQLAGRLQKSIPDLSLHPINKRYEDAIRILHQEDPVRKVFLFLGANIGNFTLPDAHAFVKKISSGMHPGDQLLIGFDLKKDPRLIHAAYDDAQGITRDFNLNLLVRLNRELGARFQTDQFSHYPYYDPETGITKSYLVSQQEQDVYIEYFDRSFHFDRWEVIHTEISQKYDHTMIHQLADHAGLKITNHFHDTKKYFCDVLLGKQ